MYKNSQSYKAQHSVKRSNFSSGSSQRLETYSKALNSKAHSKKKDNVSILNESSYIEFEGEEYAPCIKLYPVLCDSPALQAKIMTDQSLLDIESHSTSFSPSKKKQVHSESEKRKSQDSGPKKHIDKLSLKTLNSSSSSNHKKQNTRVQQSYKESRTISKVEVSKTQQTNESQTLYTKVLKQVSNKNGGQTGTSKKITKIQSLKTDKSFIDTANDLQDTTIFDTSVIDDKTNHSCIAYSSLNLLEERRPKSSLDGRINNYSSLPRDQKTPQRNAEPSKDLVSGITYEKLFKVRGSKMSSNGPSRNFSRQSTQTTKDGTPTTVSSKSREVSIKTLPDETRARKSSASLRFSHDACDIKRLNEVQNTRLDDFGNSSKIKVPQGIKVVKSLDLDQARELIPSNKGFLSKINSSNYHVAKNLSSSKGVKSMVQKSPFKNDGSALIKKKQSKGLDRTEVVSITLSKSLISLKKL